MVTVSRSNEAIEFTEVGVAFEQPGGDFRCASRADRADHGFKIEDLERDRRSLREIPLIEAGGLLRGSVGGRSDETKRPAS